MSRSMGTFILFSLSILFVWVAVGPIFREVVADGLNKIHWTGAARYVDSA